MKLEELIYKRFSESDDLANSLTTYANKPAIFFMEAAGDTQKGWSKKSQYPRIIYGLDMRANQDRKSVGTLTVSIICDSKETTPETIEPFVKDCLKDLIIKPTGTSAFAFAWARTDIFDMPDEGGVRVSGSEVLFDVIEYTEQITTNPDPIQALNIFIKNHCGEAHVLLHDWMDEYLIPTNSMPVIYCKLNSAQRARDETIGNLVSWVEARIGIHVFCPDADVRQKWIFNISNLICMRHEIDMLDNSPMRILQTQYNGSADYLKEGQITAMTRYGLLNYQSYDNGLEIPKFKPWEGNNNV